MPKKWKPAFLQSPQYKLQDLSVRIPCWELQKYLGDLLYSAEYVERFIDTVVTGSTSVNKIRLYQVRDEINTDIIKEKLREVIGLIEELTDTEKEFGKGSNFQRLTDADCIRLLEEIEGNTNE